MYMYNYIYFLISVREWIGISQSSLPASFETLGRGLLDLCSLISPIGKFLVLQKYLLDVLNLIDIWQASP